MDRDSPEARYWWWRGHDFVWRQLDEIRLHRPPPARTDLPANVIPIERYRNNPKGRKQ